MATEAPFLSHTQCTASVDMSATGALAGMNSSGQFLGVVQSATSRQIAVATTGGTGDNIIGVLQNDPKIGQAANVAFIGVTKAMASGTIASGAFVKTASNGTFVSAVVGTDKVVGVALESAVTGQVFTVQLLYSK